MKKSSLTIIVSVAVLAAIGFASYNYIFKSDYPEEDVLISDEQSVATTTIPVLDVVEESSNKNYEVKVDESQTPKETALTKDDQLNLLRDKLRKAILGGTRRSEPMRTCANSISEITEDGEEKVVKVEVQRGLTFTFSLDDNTNDNDALEILATDGDGGVAGNMSYSDNSEIRMLTTPSDVWSVRGYGALDLLSLEEPIDGDIKLRNKGSVPHMFSFYISDLLGNCDITSKITFGLGTSTSLRLPISKAGDLGPMEWDYESDGVVDMYESLIFKLSEEQIRLQQDIYALTNPNEIYEMCNNLSDLTFPQEDEYLYREILIIKEWCSDRTI